MIKFRNFRTPPLGPHESQIVLHGICNLLGKDLQLSPRGFNSLFVSRRICSVLADYGIQKSPTGDHGVCQLLVQDLIDTLVEKNILTLQQIETEVQKVSSLYPPVLY